MAQLSEAAAALGTVGEVLAKSALFLTEPVGGPANQPDYVNAVLLLRPREEHPDPRTLLRELLRVERGLGRERRERWGPRTIDLDLLDYGGRIFVAPADASGAEPLPSLRLPHPRMAERAFVLAPLADLDPRWRHPTLRLGAAELLARCGDGGVRRMQGA